MEKQFTEEKFNEEVVEASKKKPVLVDFFAAWCGPCKVQAPIIEDVAKEIGDKAVVGKINIEEAQELSGKYGVMSIPTILLFKDGEVKETLVGMQSKESLVELIEKNI